MKPKKIFIHIAIELTNNVRLQIPDHLLKYSSLNLYTIFHYINPISIDTSLIFFLNKIYLIYRLNTTSIIKFLMLKRKNKLFFLHFSLYYFNILYNTPQNYLITHSYELLCIYLVVIRNILGTYIIIDFASFEYHHI